MIVYFSFPAHGHVNPTLPVMQELASRGERIVYYGSERFEPAIRAAGAVFRPYTPRVRMPVRGPGPFARVSDTLETLLDFSGAILDRQLDEVRSLRPTHILFDSFAPWGGLMAQLLELPSIASVPSILIDGAIAARYEAGGRPPPEDPRLTPAWYAEFQSRCRARLARHRLPLSPPQLLQTYGELNLVYTSRLFQPLAERFDRRRFRFVGPCCEFRPGAPPFPFERLDGRPLVYVSLGTVYGDGTDFLRRCRDELADSAWQVVLATGSESGALDSPKNFIVRRFVPQVEILKRAAAFVTHAGMNSVQEALLHGVPLVMAPQAADQFWISARAAELGAGVQLDTRNLQDGAIRAAVAAVLSQPRYASAAARIGQSLAAAGGHRQAADEIQRFLRRDLRPAVHPQGGSAYPINREPVDEAIRVSRS